AYQARTVDKHRVWLRVCKLLRNYRVVYRRNAPQYFLWNGRRRQRTGQFAYASLVQQAKDRYNNRCHECLPQSVYKTEAAHTTANDTELGRPIFYHHSNNRAYTVQPA